MSLLAEQASALSTLLDSIMSWGLAAAGIGLVIFVHELGHFLVAKKCGVRCEVFSLGFGPRILGFVRGDTDYRLSLVPIGGYVKMAGDNPGEDLEGDESELPSKSVGQRFAIFSAGVVMNLLFALITLPVVLALGVLFHSTVLGGVTPGSPAWKAGLQEGDEINRIGKHDVYDFNDVVAQVALSDPGKLEIEVMRDGAPLVVEVEPAYDEGVGRYTIGIRPSIEDTFDLIAGGPAEVAGMKQGEKVLSVNGVPTPTLAAYNEAVSNNKSRAVQLEVQAEGEPVRSLVIQAQQDPNRTYMIGIQAYVNQVSGLRRGAERIPNFLKLGDVLVSLNLHDQDTSGEPTQRIPIRDSEDLRKAFEIAAGSEMNARLEVIRGGLPDFVPLGSPDVELVQDIALRQDENSLFVKLREGLSGGSCGASGGREDPPHRRSCRAELAGAAARGGAILGRPHRDHL